MLINKHYLEIINKIPAHNDKDYLQLQLDELSQLFFREASAIKNTDLEFIAFSNTFAEEFNFNHTYLGKKFEDIPDQDPLLVESTTKQEQAILASKKPQNHLLYTKIRNKNHCYMVRKFPLINPATNNCVGLLVFPTKIDILNIRRMASIHILNRTPNSSIVINKKFSEKESLIITSLLLGFHKRKDIAAILEKWTKNEFSELQIRNSLQTLYERYKCNSTSELIELICTSQDAPYQLPGKLIPDQIIPLDDKAN